MPCTLQPWEVEFENEQYQKRHNLELYGLEILDYPLVTGLLCELCHFCQENDIPLPTTAHKKWFKNHKKADKKMKEMRRNA